MGFILIKPCTILGGIGKETTELGIGSQGWRDSIGIDGCAENMGDMAENNTASLLGFGEDWAVVLSGPIKKLAGRCS